MSDQVISSADICSGGDICGLEKSMLINTVC